MHTASAGTGLEGLDQLFDLVSLEIMFGIGISFIFFCLDGFSEVLVSFLCLSFWFCDRSVDVEMFIFGDCLIQQDPHSFMTSTIKLERSSRIQ